MTSNANLRPINCLLLFLPMILIACGKSFTQNPNAQDANTAQLASTAPAEAGPFDLKDFNLEILGGDFKPVANPLSLREKVTYNFSIGLSQFPEALITWSIPRNTASCDITVFTGNETAAVSCTSDGEFLVQVSALLPNGTEEISSARGYVKGAGLVAIPPAVGVTIPAGAGMTANWVNQVMGTTEAALNAQLVIYVGQVLRIRNDDLIEHKPRVLNNNPCELPDVVLKTGQSVDCFVTKETNSYDSFITDALNTNGAGKLFFRTVDASRVYAQKECSSCHSPKYGSTFDEIKKAIQERPEMRKHFRPGPALANDDYVPRVPGDALYIRDADIKALVYYLGN